MIPNFPLIIERYCLDTFLHQLYTSQNQLMFPSEILDSKLPILPEINVGKQGDTWGLKLRDSYTSCKMRITISGFQSPKEDK